MMITWRMILPIFSLLAGIALCLWMEWPIAYGLAGAVLVTMPTVKGMGVSYRQQLSFGWQGWKQTKPVLSILFLVGLLIPLLMMAGTIPTIIMYGLSIVNPDYLLTIAFLLTALVSYLLGTSVGTLSTIGLSLMGMAHAVHMPLGLMAGALISGAMVGERFSPLSSSRLLVLHTIEADEHTPRFARATGWIGTSLTGLLFVGFDLANQAGSSGVNTSFYEELFARHFVISPWQLIPIAVLLGSFALRVRAIPALLYGMISAMLLVLVQGVTDIKAFLSTLLYGLRLDTGTVLDEMVHGGGVLAILYVLLLISLAGFLNGILNKANVLNPVVEKLMGKTDTPFALVAKTTALSLLVVAISGNQTIPILVLGSTLAARYAAFDRKQGKSLLGRTMLDTTLVMPVLIPWNGLAMVMSVTLGVSTAETLPYVWIAYVLPLTTLMASRFFQPDYRADTNQAHPAHTKYSP